MKNLGKIFAWFFALLSVISLWGAVMSLSPRVSDERGAQHFRTWIPSCTLLLMSYLFASAWWNVWKNRASARMWGITASAVNLLAILIAINAGHRALAQTTLVILAVSVFALIVYLWPDRDPNDPSFESHLWDRESHRTQEHSIIEKGIDLNPTSKHRVLRAYAVIISLGAAPFALLMVLHVKSEIVNALAVLACIAVLFGKQLTGRTEYVQISSPTFEHRIHNRYCSELGQLSNIGFSPLFFYGEAFPLVRLLLIYPAFLFLTMFLNREVATLQNRSKLCFGFPVFLSRDRTTYAHPLQLGVKYHTLFQDGTILMTKNFGGKKAYGPTVVVQAIENATISDTWAKHQNRLQALEATGKQINPEISFDAYSTIQCHA